MAYATTVERMIALTTKESISKILLVLTFHQSNNTMASVVGHCLIYKMQSAVYQMKPRADCLNILLSVVVPLAFSFPIVRLIKAIEIRLMTSVYIDGCYYKINEVRKCKEI